MKSVLVKTRSGNKPQDKSFFNRPGKGVFRVTTSWLWYFYSALIWLLARLAHLLAWFRPSLRTGLQGRCWSEREWASLQAWRDAYQNRVVFYCSSAGEYEQAKPLIRMLEAEHSCACLVVVFSESAVRFAKAQDDQLFIMKSPWDLFWTWQRFFQITDPKFSVIVRHELWPAFLKASTDGDRPLALIDAVAAVENSPTAFGSMKDRLKSFLYQYLTHVFVVSDEDAAQMHNRRIYAGDSLYVVGDTKYDRVFERLEERAAKRNELSTKLNALWPRKKRLVIGSGWPADIKLIGQCFQQNTEIRHSWQVVIAPHEIKSEMIEWLVAECQRLGLSYRLWTELEQPSQQAGEHEVLIVNALGILAELYGCADLAFVGGAMHYRVHNVLEPACHGLAVAFGPNYQTSQEAKWLVSRNCVRVVQNQAELLDWWQGWHKKSDLVDHLLLAEVKARCGATQRIGQELAEFFEESGIG